MALSDFQELLKSLQPHSLLPESLSRIDFTPLNLSVDNQELKSVDVGSVVELQKICMASHETAKCQSCLWWLFGEARYL